MINNIINDKLFAKSSVLAQLGYCNYSSFKGRVKDLTPSGCELFLSTDEMIDDDLKENSYKAMVFIDHEAKQIVIVTAGTRPKILKRLCEAEGQKYDELASAFIQGSQEAIADLTDDGRLALGFLPYKYKAAQALNQAIIDSFKAMPQEQGVSWQKKLAEYNLHYTGHSLGAFMTDCSVADMHCRMKEEEVKAKISAVTFDNPGSSRIVKKIMAERNHDIGELDNLDIYSFSAKANFINSVDKPLGSRIEILTEKKDRSFVAFIMHCIHICTTRIAQFFCYKLGKGPIFDQLDKHNVSYFIGVLNNKKGHYLPIYGRIGGISHVEYDADLYSEIKEIQSSKKPLAKWEKIIHMIFGPEDRFYMTGLTNKDRPIFFSKKDVFEAKENISKKQLARLNLEIQGKKIDLDDLLKNSKQVGVVLSTVNPGKRAALAKLNMALVEEQISHETTAKNTVSISSELTRIKAKKNLVKDLGEGGASNPKPTSPRSTSPQGLTNSHNNKGRS